RPAEQRADAAGARATGDGDVHRLAGRLVLPGAKAQAAAVLHLRVGVGKAAPWRGHTAVSAAVAAIRGVDEARPRGAHLAAPAELHAGAILVAHANGETESAVGRRGPAQDAVAVVAVVATEACAGWPVDQFIDEWPAATLHHDRQFIGHAHVRIAM